MPLVTNEVTITYGDVQIASVASGTGVYTLSTNQPKDWILLDTYVAIFECTNAANNGIFKVTGVSGNNITIANSSSVVEASSPGAMGFPVGGASEFLLNGQKNYTKVGTNFDLLTVAFDVFLNSESATESTAEREFKNRCRSLELAFSTPRQRLRWIQGAQTFLDLDPEAGAGKNTGYDHRPRADKSADKEFDTGRSRQYSVSVEIKLPATFLPYMSGLKDVSYSVDYEDTNRRTVTISGTYTAYGANDADAQYQANAATFSTSVLNTVDAVGNFNLARQSKRIVSHVEPDSSGAITGKELEFTRVYEEIVYDELQGTLNDPAITAQSLKVSRKYFAPGDFLFDRFGAGGGVGGGGSGPGGAPNRPGFQFPSAIVFSGGGSIAIGIQAQAGGGGGGAIPNRLVELTAVYSCSIDKEVTTDLRSKWTVIEPWLIKNVIDTLQGGHLAITEISPDYDYAANRITATLVGLAAKTKLIESEVSVEILNDTGAVLEPVWNGNPYARLDWDGPANRRKTESFRQVMVGLIGPEGSGEPSFTQFSMLAGNWKPMQERIAYKAKKMGMAGYSFDITEITGNYVHDYYVPVLLPSGGDIPTPGGKITPIFTGQIIKA